MTPALLLWRVSLEPSRCCKPTCRALLQARSQVLNPILSCYTSTRVSLGSCSVAISGSGWMRLRYPLM